MTKSPGNVFDTKLTTAPHCPTSTGFVTRYDVLYGPKCLIGAVANDHVIAIKEANTRIAISGKY